MNTASSAPTLDQAAASSPRTPVPQLVEALKRVTPLNGLEDNEYVWLATHAIERCIPDGTTMFHEGDAAEAMSIVLRGEVHVRRERGHSALFIGRSGQITGLLPFSRMKTYGGQGYTVGDVWALEFPRAIFASMMEAVPSMVQRCVSVLLDRVREVTRLEQQTEKLSALGKLAANLAHEMNNPASAAQRAASGLLDELRTYGHEKYRLGSLCLDTAHMDQVGAWQDSIRQHALHSPPDSIRFAQSEDEIQEWLRSHGVQEGWKVSPELAELGVTAAQLEPLGGFLNAEALTVVLGQFASSIRAERIAEAMLDSTARIFDLIRAIKDYSYMDQAPIQEVDVRAALENTLTMLQSRLAHVEIERRYAEELPCIAAYGSELNQVWMALLENALDAIDDHGKISLVVEISGEMLLIEVWDNGIGIEPEMRDRIFEPFYTTKAPGRGLGLGLDTVQRIVRRHRGYVSVESKPGATCFQIRLPIEQLLAY